VAHTQRRQSQQVLARVTAAGGSAALLSVAGRIRCPLAIRRPRPPLAGQFVNAKQSRYIETVINWSLADQGFFRGG